MDIFKGTFPGLLILLGLFCFADAQTCTTIENCSQCAGTICLTCSDGYSQNFGNTGCCSKGCQTDENGFHLCNINTGMCSYENCVPGHYGPYCLRCNSKIQNCDNCGVVQGTTDTVECITCATTFFKTTDNQHCCPMGCDSCTGASGTTCTSCKASYFLYNEKCDTCGNNCVEPTDGSARCNPVTGSCYLGCKDGWHGSKCDVQCTLSRCDRCTYDEPTNSLTCEDCNSGYYGPFCVACSATCASVANGDLCSHEGTCSSGCLPGYRGNKCDITCDSANDLQNCLECERYAFTCTKCKAGFWGPQCQNNCHANCVEFLGERNCAINNGTCDFGCLATHYKMDCSGSCPHCGNDVCERETGVCLDPICDAGFWGRNCNNSCPAHCRPQTLQGVATCNFQNGNCTTGCTDGNWGEFCNEGCSVNCALSPQATETGPLCTQSDGTCVHQCKAGSYRPDCSETCQSECVTGACDITDGICVECRAENPGYLCPEGTCAVGSYGQYCNLTCAGSDQCQNGLCNRYTGYCEGCVLSKWDIFCNSSCFNCIDGLCNQDDGVCEIACINRYYGQQCNTACHSRCLKCDRDDGECMVCDIGTFGELCENDCSLNCQPESTGFITCSKDGGVCTSGPCLPGYFDSTCRSECNRYCAPDVHGLVRCDLDSGHCLNGCYIGHFGPTCSGICSENCFTKECYKSADNCTVRCIDTQYNFPTCDIKCNDNCISDTCFDGNGTCIFGCEPGYFGNRCEQTCNLDDSCIDSTCDRIYGTCPECSKSNPSFLCRDAGCPLGSYGLFCNNTCKGRSLCLGSQCDRESGICSGCSTGRYGDYCESECPNCLNGSCSQTDGMCLDGCQNGFFGQFCEKECFGRCEVCNQLLGSCERCRVGTHGGDGCRFNCSENCLPSTDGLVRCSKDNGVCDEGVCNYGYHGRLCNKKCSENCRPDALNATSCDIDTGECTSGCNIGFYGPYCDQRCSVQCNHQHCLDFYNSCVDGCVSEFWGPTCDIACDFACLDRSCDDVTGFCNDGCTDGQFGNKCESKCFDTCIDNTCNRTLGRCSACFDEANGYQCRSAGKTCMPISLMIIRFLTAWNFFRNNSLQF